MFVLGHSRHIIHSLILRQVYQILRVVSKRGSRVVGPIPRQLYIILLTLLFFLHHSCCCCCCLNLYRGIFRLVPGIPFWLTCKPGCQSLSINATLVNLLNTVYRFSAKLSEYDKKQPLSRITVCARMHIKIIENVHSWIGYITSVLGITLIPQNILVRFQRIPSKSQQFPIATKSNQGVYFG